MGAEDVYGSCGEPALESEKGEHRSGNGHGAGQSAEQHEKKQGVQREPGGPRDVVPALEQRFVPDAVEPCVQNKREGQQHAQPLMDRAAGMGGGHEQKKQQQEHKIRENG